MNHWMSHTKFYYIWRGIINRCCNKNTKYFFNYWWRGIKCEWNSFQEFYNDMFDTYKDWLSIERIDNNWNYCRWNCKWIERWMQSRNTRNSVIINWIHINDLCTITGINKSTIYLRYKNWWTFNQIIGVEKPIEKRWKHWEWTKWKVFLSWKKWFLHPSSKKVIQKDINWYTIKDWDSISDAHQNTNISISNISKCCNGKRLMAWWFKWEYTNS